MPDAPQDPGATGATGATDEDVEVAPLELTDEEIELVGLDLDVLLPTLDGPRRERYEELREAVGSGQVSAGLQPALESLLELTLQTARARTRYRAEGEQILTKLYTRTASGRGLADHLGQVNEALRSLAGQTIGSVNVRMRTVGHFTVTIQTDGATITLATRPDSLDVESIAVGS